MKKIAVIIILLTICQCYLFAQSYSHDTLTWYTYGGKPPTVLLATQKKVALSWGIKINYTTMSCDGEHADQIKELENKNKPVYQYLENRFSADWKTMFDIEVEKEMNRKSDK